MYRMTDPYKAKALQHYVIYARKVIDAIQKALTPKAGTGVAKVRVGTYAAKFLQDARDNTNGMLKTLLMGTFAEQKQLVGVVDAALNAWEAHTPGTKNYFQEVMKELFGSMKDVEIVGDTVTIRSRMKETDIPALEALADAILQ